jgi:hypothetical protein
MLGIELDTLKKGSHEKKKYRVLSLEYVPERRGHVVT